MKYLISGEIKLSIHYVFKQQDLSKYILSKFLNEIRDLNTLEINDFNLLRKF